MIVVVWLSEPFVAVTVTVYVPLAVPLCVLMVRMLVPGVPLEHVTLVWLKEAKGPLLPAPEIVAERPTVPENPLTEVIVIVEVPEDPWVMVSVFVEAVIVKSTTFTVTATVWTVGPLVPVIVTVYVPTVDELKVQVEAPLPPDPSVMLVGVHEVATPAGEDVDTVTVPAKPLTLTRLMLEVLVEPLLKVTAFGLAVRLKSRTV